MGANSHGNIRRAAAVLLATVGFALAGSATAKNAPEPPYEYGPEPDWNRYRELGEQAIRNILIDPDAAKFEWHNGYLKRGWKPSFERRVPGYVTCGLVNSRNSFGGYTGRAYFVVVIDNDRVKYANVGNGGGRDEIAEGCKVAVFPLPPTLAAPVARPQTAPTSMSAPAPTMSVFGLDLIAMPDGAYVSAVTPDGTGDHAGIKPGMVIARINGIALKGMSADAIARLLPSLGSSASFEMIGGTVIAVKQP